MKKYINSGRAGSLFATLLFCLVSLGSAQAQEASADDAIEVVREGIAHDALYAIEISGESGFAVGAFGLMLETADGGNSWTLVEPKTQLSLLGIARGGDKHVVVGQQGVVLTRAGGGDWEATDSGLTQRLLNVGMNSSGMAVAVGEFGFAAVSMDAGHTWKPIVVDWEQYNEEGYEPHLYDATVAEDGTLMIAGEFGLILRSTDGGATLEKAAEGDESIFDIDIARDGSNTGYAVGQEGLVLKTLDAGVTWQRVDADTKANLLGVWSGNGEVVISGIREMLRSSDDGGSFSKTVDIKIGRTWYQGIAAGVSETQSGAKGFLREQSVYVVGHRATIARVVK